MGRHTITWWICIYFLPTNPDCEQSNLSMIVKIVPRMEYSPLSKFDHSPNHLQLQTLLTTSMQLSWTKSTQKVFFNIHQHKMVRIRFTRAVSRQSHLHTSRQNWQYLHSSKLRRHVFRSVRAAICLAHQAYSIRSLRRKYRSRLPGHFLRLTKVDFFITISSIARHGYVIRIRRSNMLTMI